MENIKGETSLKSFVNIYNANNDEISNKIKTLEGNIATMSETIVALNTRINTQNNNIAYLKKQIEKLTVLEKDTEAYTELVNKINLIFDILGSSEYILNEYIDTNTEQI